MHSFLSVLTTIKDGNAGDTAALKMKVKSLTEGLQREQIKSQTLEEEFLQNSLKFQLIAQINEELDVKLNYHTQECEFLRNQLNDFNSTFQELSKTIKNKEKSQDVILKDINNFQELISQIVNNNKIIEENFSLSLMPLDLKTLGLDLGKKPRPQQKSSFLEFIAARKNLESKRFKLKLKLSEVQLKKKQQSLRFTAKMRSLKNLGDNFKTAMLASNEKMLKTLQLEVVEKKAEIEKTQLQTLPMITECQENSLISQISSLKKQSILQDLKLKHLGFKILNTQNQTPSLSSLIELFIEGLSNQREKEMILTQNELSNHCNKSAALAEAITEVKEQAGLTKNIWLEVEPDFRKSIKKLNALKFELCLYDKKIENKNKSQIYSLQNPNSDLLFLHSESIEAKTPVAKANTIHSIDTLEVIIEKNLKKKKTFELKSNLLESPGLRISNLEHYQMKSKLNSLKEDHQLFSSFIDFRLNPGKFQRIIESQRTILLPQQTQNNLKLTQMNDIANSDRPPFPSTMTFENSSPILDYNLSPQVLPNEDAICTQGSVNEFALGDNEHDEEVERVLKEEVVISWGNRKGVMKQIMGYMVMAVFLVISQIVAVAAGVRRRMWI